jgi:hypothetical protein
MRGMTLIGVTCCKLIWMNVHTLYAGGRLSIFHLHGILFQIFASSIHKSCDIRRSFIVAGHIRRRRLTTPPIPLILHTLFPILRIRRVPSSRMPYIRGTPHNDIPPIAPAPAPAFRAEVEARPEESNNRPQAEETGAHDADV